MAQFPRHTKHIPRRQKVVTTRTLSKEGNPSGEMVLHLLSFTGTKVQILTHKARQSSCRLRLRLSYCIQGQYDLLSSMRIRDFLVEPAYFVLSCRRDNFDLETPNLTSFPLEILLQTLK